MAAEEGVRVEHLKAMWGISYSELESLAKEHGLIISGDKVFAPFVKHLIFKVYGGKQ